MSGSQWNAETARRLQAEINEALRCASKYAMPHFEDLESALARIAELEAGLRPFANVAGWSSPKATDAEAESLWLFGSDYYAHARGITLGDCRRARALVEREEA